MGVEMKPFVAVHHVGSGVSAAALLERAIALVARRRMTSESLVEVSPLPNSVEKRQQLYHRMQIGPWHCQLKLTSLCIVLEVRSDQGGPVGIMTVGNSASLMVFDESNPVFFLTKDNHKCIFLLGSDAATVAEIAYQYGLEFGPRLSNSNAQFFESPAFDTLARTVLALPKPLNPIFRKPYSALGDWYSAALKQPKKPTAPAPAARQVKVTSPTPSINGLVAGKKLAALPGGFDCKVPRSALLGWSQRHGINLPTDARLLAALQDAAAVVLLEYLNAPGKGVDAPASDLAPWTIQLLRRSQVDASSSPQSGEAPSQVIGAETQ